MTLAARRKISLSALTAAILAFGFAAPGAHAQRTELEPGFNLYSPEDDIAIGRQFIERTESGLDTIGDEILAEYVNRIGQQLALEAPGYRYPYRFRLVNDAAINAFALPGGPVYLNRGIVVEADREAEVAGVLAHEIAHVALRHGTNQASKSQLVQAPLSILGGIFGGGGATSILTRVGAGFAANSLFLKYSREAERQADLLGAQILYDAGYDPTGMPEFFEKLEAQGGSAGVEFFSSHPNPGNRAAEVADEIGLLGPSPPSYIENFSDFRRIKERLADIPEVSADEPGQPSAPRTSLDPPDVPSGRYELYRTRSLEFFHPANWTPNPGEDSVTLAPDGGFGERGLSHGVLISIFEPAPGGRVPIALEDATDRLLASLREANPSIRVVQGYRPGLIDGGRALSLELEMESPAGGMERDWLMTTFSPDGDFYYFAGVAPEGEFDLYLESFQSLFESIRFR